MRLETLRTFQRHPDLYEAVVSGLIRSVPRGGVFIDGGAHAGQHLRTMLQRSDVRRAYAIEAIPHLCDHLDTEFGGDARLRLVRGAIGKTSGMAQFAVAANAPGYSGLRQRDIQEVNAWTQLETPVFRLDEVIDESDRGDVSVIKLDLEGGELDALIGARQIISRSNPLMVFENALRATASQYDYGWSEFAEFFSSINYEVYDFFGNRVDKNCWDGVLQTYMFVATRRYSESDTWRIVQMPKLVYAASAGLGSLGLAGGGLG